jgi:integrase
MDGAHGYARNTLESYGRVIALPALRRGVKLQRPEDVSILALDGYFLWPRGRAPPDGAHPVMGLARARGPRGQAAVAIAYTFGWRMQSEVLSLERRHLDLGARHAAPGPGMTKNDEGRVVYLTGDLKALLTGQVERVDALQQQLGRIIPFLFPHLKDRHQGTRIGDFRKAWATPAAGRACRAGYAMTSAGPSSAAWSAPGSRGRWPPS